MHVMTRRGWQPLVVHCVHEVWQANEEGRLEFVESNAKPIEFGPPIYKGPLPSFELMAFVRRLQRDVNESREQRKLPPLEFR